MAGWASSADSYPCDLNFIVSSIARWNSYAYSTDRKAMIKCMEGACGKGPSNLLTTSLFTPLKSYIMMRRKC
jgi:hypothetical protein